MTVDPNESVERGSHKDKPVEPDPAAGVPIAATATNRNDVLIRWRWPLTFLIFFGLVIGAVLYSFRLSLDRTADAAGAAKDTVAEAARAVVETASDVARTFYSGDVTERFVAAIPEIEGAGVGRLELAKAQTVETFTRSDERRVLWDLVSLGTSVSEIRVPVTYRYHLSLNEPWQVVIEDGIALVRAPAIRPTVPVAIHTDRLEKRNDAGWLRFDEDEQMEALERSITPRLTALARDPRHLGLVRDEARRTVASFVRGWLLREDQWGAEDGVRAIKVLFDDEDIDALEIGASIVLPKPSG